MFYARIGRDNSTKHILYLSSLKMEKVTNYTCFTESHVIEVLGETGASEVMFESTALPRHSVEIAHEKFREHLRKFVYGSQKCPECNGPMRQIMRGASLRKNGPLFVCITNEFCAMDSRHKYLRTWTISELMEEHKHVQRTS